MSFYIFFYRNASKKVKIFQVKKRRENKIHKEIFIQQAGINHRGHILRKYFLLEGI